MMKRTPNARRRTSNVECRRAFTLIELLVVIGIIAILLGLVFPVFQGVLERAKKVQAKNDLTQIVTAVNAFYTEYGRYPTTSTSDVILGAAGSAKSDALFGELRGGGTINTRQIQFISPPEDKSQLNPKGKIGSDGQFYDPWGATYNIAIDANYNNIVNGPAYSDLQTNYTTATDGSGDKGVRLGVIGWSVGKDGQSGNKGDNKFTSSDDVISWQ
jgi:prepilin-type N-terminal cleavage/methylation domain-containing protein